MNPINYLLSDSFSSSNEKIKQQNQEDAHKFNVDLLEPISKEDKISDALDNILTSMGQNESNEDHISNSTSSSNIESDIHSLKTTCIIDTNISSNNENEVTKTNSIGQTNGNQENKVQHLNRTLENISYNGNNERNEESNTKTTLPGGYRARRLRIRSCQQRPSISQESTSDNQTQFYASNETTNVSVSINSLNISTGVLSRTHCIGKTKKAVHFADSDGGELTQVQYFQSFTDEDSTKLRFLSNNLYVPKLLNLDYKPWTFDVELTSKQTSSIRMPKIFFSLYRQPNSEHPDVYLHEVWKSQIKLEFASIRVKSLLTGEQYLYGTAWVTNGGYQKHVALQYTFSRWANKNEREAKHLFHSNDFRNLDKFEFNTDIPNDIDRVDFVLRYRVNGQEHWDNNEGKNYTLETESAYTPKTTISLPHDCNLDEMRFY
ncbi:unnamed protein product [Rotaria magnacalcarata]|uniref:CBM21 domain-containing protein n=3 Tax=Rotaria magnacalcarata TaxID=392030 RepID=A0A820F662_9BILA|nr:unnamed protein product [Rotaria magnacalcarata]CAF4256189.1 unnamed protein product [Rotaria magnacalcarata]